MFTYGLKLHFTLRTETSHFDYPEIQISYEDAAVAPEADGAAAFFPFAGAFLPAFGFAAALGFFGDLAFFGDAAAFGLAALVFLGLAGFLAAAGFLVTFGLAAAAAGVGLAVEAAAAVVEADAAFGFLALDAAAFFAAGFFFAAGLAAFGFLVAFGFGDAALAGALCDFLATAPSAGFLSPKRKLPAAPVPFDCFKLPVVTPRFKANFKRLLTNLASLPTL